MQERGGRDSGMSASYHSQERFVPEILYGRDARPAAIFALCPSSI